MKTLYLLFTTLMCCILLNCVPVVTKSITVGWNHNTEPDLMKYRAYSDSVLMGSTEDTVFTFKELPDSSLITVTALDSMGNQSGHSEPVQYVKVK